MVAGEEQITEGLDQLSKSLQRIFYGIQRLNKRLDNIENQPNQSVSDAFFDERLKEMAVEYVKYLQNELGPIRRNQESILLRLNEAAGRLEKLGE